MKNYNIRRERQENRNYFLFYREELVADNSDASAAIALREEICFWFLIPSCFLHRNSFPYENISTISYENETQAPTDLVLAKPDHGKFQKLLFKTKQKKKSKGNEGRRETCNNELYSAVSAVVPMSAIVV